MDVIGLSEALPFLVVTIGFDKPLRLARAVVEHPRLLPPSVTNGNAPRTGGMPRRKNKPASEIVLEAISKVGPSIVRDYAAEVVVLVVGSSSGVHGLKEFCALAALILVLDCVGLFSVYAAVLAIVVEVRSYFYVHPLRQHIMLRSAAYVPCATLKKQCSQLVLPEQTRPLPVAPDLRRCPSTTASWIRSLVPRGAMEL